MSSSGTLDNPTVDIIGPSPDTPAHLRTWCVRLTCFHEGRPFAMETICTSRPRHNEWPPCPVMCEVLELFTSEVLGKVAEEKMRRSGITSMEQRALDAAIQWYEKDRKPAGIGMIRAIIRSLGVVDHAHLDVAVKGLPIESGRAAQLWLAAIKAASPEE